MLSVGSGTTTVRIDGNNISGAGTNGINVQMSEDANTAHTMNATIFDNTVSATGVNSFDGIRVVAGAGAGDVGILRLDMHDNTAHSETANDFTVRQRFSTTVELLNYAGGSTDTAAVQTYLDVTRANNPSAPAVWFITTQAPGGGFVTTASVPAPTLPSPGSPLLAAGGQGAGGVALTAGPLAPIAEEAVDRWIAAGISAEQLATLTGITISVADLADGVLASFSGDRIVIDDDAAGHGWFTDSSPEDNFEFGTVHSAMELAATSGDAANHIDLLTAVMHELGHAIGLDHSDGDDVMGTALDLGVRLLPIMTDYQIL